MRWETGGVLIGVIGAAVLLGVGGANWGFSLGGGPAGAAGAEQSGRPAAETGPAEESESLPGRGKDYAGLTKCAACHFREYRDWQSTPHGNAFKILPAKYRNDASCLSCHTTRPAAGSSNRPHPAAHTQGVSCESCHGPGEEHAKYALSFVGRERTFTEQELSALRSKIKRLAVDQCVKCHISKAHKRHPKFDRDPQPAGTGSRSAATPTDARREFFEGHRGPPR